MQHIQHMQHIQQVPHMQQSGSEVRKHRILRLCVRKHSVFDVFSGSEYENMVFLRNRGKRFCGSEYENTVFLMKTPCLAMF